MRMRSWRLAATTTLAMLIAGLATVAAPTPAHAGTYGPDIPCPSDPNIIWTLRGAGRVPVWEGIHYSVLSATPTFAVSDGRVVDNTLSEPIQATFTSQQSRMHQITVTIGTSAQLTNKLQANVSVAIVQSRTTAIGVNATVTVPANSRVIGRYGVEAFDVAYDAQVVWQSVDVRKPGSFGGHCWDRGTQRAGTLAPTVVEGWRFSTS